MAATPPPLAQDIPAIDFRLPGTDGRIYALDDIAGKNGTVIVFICNHCPYVKAVIDRLVTDARTLMAEGIGFAAICSNDVAAYPEDSFEAMQRFAQAHALPFPYLHDEDQSVARAYDAVCTPDFFGMTRTVGSNTVVALMRAAPLRRRPARAGSWSRPCGPTRRPARRRPGKRRRSDVPSNGSQEREGVADQQADGDPAHGLVGHPCRMNPEEAGE